MFQKHFVFFIFFFYFLYIRCQCCSKYKRFFFFSTHVLKSIFTITFLFFSIMFFSFCLFYVFDHPTSTFRYLFFGCFKNKNSIDWGPTYSLRNKPASGWHFLFKFTKRKRKSAEAMIGSIHHGLSKGDCIIKRVRDLNFLHFLQSFTEKCNKTIE